MKINKFFSAFAILTLLNTTSIYCLVGLASAKANTVIVQSDGKIVAVGGANVGNVNQGIIVRYNSDGTLDNTFNGGVVTTVVGDNAVFNGVVQQADGKLVAVGSAGLNTTPQYIAVRYNSNGTLDTAFGNQGISTSVIQSISSAAYSVVQQTDGKLVFTGYSSPANNPTAQRFFTVRLNGNGSLDTSFGSGGAVFTSIGNFGFGYQLFIQPADGKIVIFGSGSDSFDAIRYNTNGSVDTTFGSSGIANFVTGSFIQQCTCGLLQQDGKIIMGGYGDNSFALIRITSSGAIDNSYGSAGNGRVLTPFAAPAEIFSLVLQSDGKVVAVGYMDNQIALARYTTSGVLDATYGTGGIVTTQIGSSARVLSGALQITDGKVVVAGYSTPNLFVSRYNTNGTVDNGFGVVSSPNACSTALCAYGQVYNVSAVDILNNAAFTFDSNGILQNVSHTVGSSDVLLGLAGIYLVTYIVEIQGNSLLQLQQNGNVVAGGNYLNGTTSIAVGKAIINANAGDVLTLVNVTGYDQPLLSGGVNASITVEKIA